MLLHLRPAFRRTTRILIALLLVTSAVEPLIARPRPKPEKKGEKQPGYPEEYVRWRESFYQDETGKVDPARMQRAREAARKMPLNPKLLPAVKRSPGQPDGLISPTDWEWRGPGNVGGRVRTLVIHPTQTNRIWIGSVAGGIWYSSNSGESWAPVDDFMANLAVCSLVINPANPDVMYAGTGEGYFNNDSIRGAGIFKSTDGGVTWTHLAATNTADFLYVNGLAVSVDGTKLLAATGSGIWRSVDGGTTWARVLATSDQMTQVAFDPNNPVEAIAAGFSGRIYVGTSGGVKWTAATGLGAFSGSRSGRVEFAFAKSAPTIVYVAYWTGATAQLYKSTNRGRSYAQVAINGGLNWMGGQGWYDNVIWVDPTNPNTLIVGGIDLFRSTDGGVNFTKISDWMQAPASAHADQHGIFADPGYNGTTNTRVYFTNDGGVYRTENVHTLAVRSGWQELNNNLGITQFFGAAGNADTMTIIGGTQDNGTLRYRPLTGTEGFSQMEGGDGGYCASDKTDPNYFYAEYIYAQILRSTDGGRSTESDIWTGITEAGSSAGAEFIAPFILDPAAQSRMLVGAKSLWRSDDVKAETPSWRAIKPPIGTSRGDNITAVGVAPSNSDIVWVGHGNGSVYKTANGTALNPTWSKVDENGGALPNRRVGRVVVDPSNADRVYVCFGGYSDPANYGAANLWRTDDGGATWTSVSGNLPLVPIFSLVVRPDSTNVLYIGTDVGVFGSEDGGATWSTTNVGPSNVSTTEVFFVGHHLAACTHGRGIFTVPVVPPPYDWRAPTVTISPDETVTNAYPLVFRFEFDEPVTGFTQSDITIAGASALEFSGTGSVYFLSVVPVGDGTVSVSIPANACTDTTGNALAAPASAAVVHNASQPFLYSTGFDGTAAPRGWQVFEGQWEWGNPVKPGGPGADRSGSGKAFATKLDVDYDDNAYAILTTPALTIPANVANPYKLRFWMWLSTEETYDGGHLQISVDGGPFHLLPASALTTAYNSSVVSGLIHQPGYSGTGTFESWRRVRANLSAYAGRTVRFRFVFGSDIYETGAGWFIDDFAIEQDPIISLAATAPIAHEGGANGRFTLLVNPSAPEARTINYTVGGNAVPGVSYVALNGSASVAPGTNSLQLPIAVLDDGATALRNETVTLSLNDGVDYAIGSPTNALVVIVGSGGYDQWRAANFSAEQIADDSISGVNASPSGDGVSNLMKHALGLNPHQSSAAQLPRAEFVDIVGLRYQQLRVVSPSSTPVNYVGQVSSDLAQWSSSAEHVAVTVQPETPAPGQTTRLFRDLTPTTSGRRFIRLQVQLP